MVTVTLFCKQEDDGRFNGIIGVTVDRATTNTSMVTMRLPSGPVVPSDVKFIPEDIPLFGVMSSGDGYPQYVFASDGDIMTEVPRWEDTHLPAVPIERNGRPGSPHLEWARDYLELLAAAERAMGIE